MIPYGAPGNVTLTSSGLVGTIGHPIRVFSTVLLSGGTASTCSLLNGTTSGGTPYIQLDGTINLCTTQDFKYGILFPSGCYFNADANLSYCTIVYSEEK
jgi:hypothetical protein